MTEHDIELAKQAGFAIDDEGEPLVYFKEQWIDVTEELTKFAELIRAEKPQGEAVGEVSSNTYSDNKNYKYRVILYTNQLLEANAKLYTIPPDQSAEKIAIEILENT
jgi:hypothetical protein